MSILITVLLGLWVLVALLMMLVILMQRPKSEGLGAAFGGAVTENLFGAQTTNVLVKFTAWLAGIFFFITFLLSVLYAHRSMGGSSLSRELKKTAPAAAVSPAPAKPGSSVAPGTSPTTAGFPAAATSPASSASVAPQAASSASVAPAGSPAAAASASPKP
jgi:preprotein translocase subunit SecG